MQAQTQNHELPPQVEPGDFKLHMGIAEQGKVYAVEGNHKMALLYLRHAMHMCVQAGDPELFFRLYLEAALESMERLGYYDEVLGYTDKAIQLYIDNPPPNKVAKMDLAYIHQKRGVILLKLGQPKESAKAFKIAIEMMKAENHPMPLANALLRWASTGLHVDARRILAEQEKSKYFTVIEENVEPSRAIRLPNEEMLQFA